MVRTFLGILLLSLTALVARAETPDATEIERLVKQLGDDDFDTRETATKRLKEIGEPALDALRKAATNDDAEVRRRAQEALAFIKKKFLAEQRSFTGHSGAVDCLAVSTDGKRVLTGSEDKTLRLWDADTGKCLRVFEGHTDRVLGAALSPDGQRVLTGGKANNVRLCHATAGEEVVKKADHTEAL